MSLKDHIITTTIQLFSRNGIKRVSMDEVARKANVSKRTLYDFFEDKETLLISVLNTIYDPFVEQMKLLEQQSDTTLETILLYNENMMEQPIWFCNDFLEDIKRFPKAFDFMVTRKSFFIKKWIELLKRGEKESVFLANINYDLISLMVQQQFNKTEPSELFTKYSHREVHDTFFYIFLRGICTDTGRDIMDKFFTKKKYKQGLESN
jgi:AcrR family transcriptional regulator